MRKLFPSPVVRQAFISLALFSGLCLVLLSIRLYFSKNSTYIFLAWNLFLAWIPFFLTTLMQFIPAKKKASLLLLLPLAGLWLLFFPNAPYIITDLIHLKARPPIPHWFDIMLLASFALNAFLIGIFSLYQIFELVSKWFNRTISWIACFGFVFLSSLGVYIGRFLRWNSWEVFYHPISFTKHVGHHLIHPFTYPESVGITLFLGAITFATFFFFTSVLSAARK